MWQSCLLLMSSVLFTGSLNARAQQTQPARSVEPIEYDLLVGDKEYPAIPNQPFVIVTPEGRELKVVLKRRELLHFEGRGIEFDYSRQMQVSVEPDLGFATITAETTDSVLVVVQVYSAAASLFISPDYLAEQLIDGYRVNLGATGIRLLDDKPERFILGKQRPGSKLTFDFSGLINTVEVYSFKHAGRLFGIVLQNDHEDTAQAKHCFETILNSLKLSSSKPATHPESQSARSNRAFRADR